MTRCARRGSVRFMKPRWIKKRTVAQNGRSETWPGVSSLRCSSAQEGQIPCTERCISPRVQIHLQLLPESCVVTDLVAPGTDRDEPAQRLDLGQRYLPFGHQDAAFVRDPLALGDDARQEEHRDGGNRDASLTPKDEIRLPSRGPWTLAQTRMPQRNE